MRKHNMQRKQRIDNEFSWRRKMRLQRALVCKISRLAAETLPADQREANDLLYKVLRAARLDVEQQLRIYKSRPPAAAADDWSMFIKRKNLPIGARLSFSWWTGPSSLLRYHVWFSRVEEIVVVDNAFVDLEWKNYQISYRNEQQI